MKSELRTMKFLNFNQSLKPYKSHYKILQDIKNMKLDQNYKMMKSTILIKELE